MLRLAKIIEVIIVQCARDLANSIDYFVHCAHVEMHSTTVMTIEENVSRIIRFMHRGIITMLLCALCSYACSLLRLYFVSVVQLLYRDNVRVFTRIHINRRGRVREIAYQ